MRFLTKYAVLISLLIVFLSPVVNAQTDNGHTGATFTLINNSPDSQYFTARIELKNIPAAGEYELAFNSVRPLLSATNGKLIDLKQGGDFYLLKFTIPQGSHSINFDINGLCENIMTRLKAIF
jgi:hypothetical protein